MAKKTLELRCCCDAGKLLGWIDVDESDIKRGFVEFCPLLTSPRKINDEKTGPGPGEAFEQIRLEISEVFDYPSQIPDQALSVPFNSAVRESFRKSYHPAIKSHDYPIETLRRIPGFVENKMGSK